MEYEIYLNSYVHVFIPAVHFSNSLSETNLYLNIISSNVNSSFEQKGAASLKVSCMAISFYSYDREKLDVWTVKIISCHREDLVTEDLTNYLSH